ncbi:MAG TPA: M14 family metallopeptidase [Phototrophicaceae bacterium]|jgi:murein tripeptide amidase MpaA|nr:M14 family metallopeptidase [Phototrophicaceae bacterium]
MPDIQFDRYYRYDDLTRLVQAYAAEYPKLVSVESIGKSYEGRDIWVASVTNTATGPHQEKPALWVDGNIHATEVSPSSACLYLLNKLTTQYGKDADITRALDTRVFYICPRLNPDGAEWALADKPKFIRSSTRPYPYDEEPLGGLEQEDIDGDGRVLMMRIADDNGEWKAHPDDPRLLVRRDPTEIGGTYYRVIPEGKLVDYDGVTITPRPRKENLDINRNFPSNWRQEYQQYGSGPYPTSEPEVRAIVQFISSHPNVTGGVAFHTFSGVLLRPYDDKADDAFPVNDLKTYKQIGQKGTDLTGYPNIAVFHDFKYDPKEHISGVFDDWAYEHMGIFAWTVELWSPQRQAGIEKYKYIEWYESHPIEEDFQMLKWNDEVLEGKAFINWYSFDHPQLGKVELGGWDFQYAWRNPPPHLLEKEIAPFADWLIWHLLISPKLELYKAEITPLGNEAYHVRVVVHNTGWLPTYITKKAVEKRVVRPLVCEIELPDGATLKSGKLREEYDQLEGRAYTATALNIWSIDATTADRLKCEWVIHAPKGGKLKVTARHARAGTVRVELDLK